MNKNKSPQCFANDCSCFWPPWRQWDFQILIFSTWLLFCAQTRSNGCKVETQLIKLFLTRHEESTLNCVKTHELKCHVQLQRPFLKISLSIYSARETTQNLKVFSNLIVLATAICKSETWQTMIFLIGRWDKNWDWGSGRKSHINAKLWNMTIWALLHNSKHV